MAIHPPADWPLWEWTRPPCWARRDKERHRAGWTQKGRLHCQPRMAAAPPSFRTSGLPEPTSPPTGHNPALGGSVVGRNNKNNYLRHWVIIRSLTNGPNSKRNLTMSLRENSRYVCAIVLMKSPRVRCNLASRRRWWWWYHWEYLPCTSQSLPAYSDRLHPAGCCPASSLCGARGM